MKHPKFGLIGLLLFLFSYASTELSAQQAEQGVLDLRGYVIGESTEIGLDGDWGFVWGELIDPATYYGPSQFIEVPGNWNDFEQDGQEIGADGYGSYVLEILFDDSISNLGLNLTAISTAFTLYLNGQQIASAGQVGTSSALSMPKYNPGVVFFNATPRTRLVIHVSNYNHRHGGIRDQLTLGNPNYLVKKRSLLLMASIFLCGCFFVMAMYHLTLYFIQRDLSPLVFSAFCLILTLRILVTGNIPITLITDISWPALIRNEYFTFFMSILLFLIFFASLFKRYRIKWVEYPMYGYLLFMTALILITPPVFFTKLLVYTQILVLAAAIYSFYILAKEYRSGNKEALIFFAGYIFILVTVVNDILFVNDYIESGHMFSLGLFLFLGSQAVLLSRRYSAAFTTNTQLLNELNKVNRQLEDKVLQRTTDLNNKNNALEEQNIKITQQNHELRKLNSELDRFVYSVSHDLKAPIASILGLIHISENEENVDKLKSYMAMMSRSLHKQSEFISDILDYAKNRRLELNEDEIDFKTLVNRILEQHEFIENWGAIKKNVEVKQSEQFVSDLQRISIVLNNVISNALKYSNTSNLHPEVTIKVEVNSDKAIIVVDDNGCGIDQEHQDKIFDMFYRADDRMHGSGLGLYIVSETLNRLSGDISVRSSRGAGTTMTITIPNNFNKYEED